LLNSLETGDSILDIVGPLGKPSEIASYGTVVTIGGGVGTAMAYPTAAAMKRAGNRVIAILGGRNKDLVILEDEMKEVSDTVFVMTDDGSYADKGFVTDKLRQLIENGTRIDLVLAIGPIPMMRAVAEMTRKERIRTIVSLNPIMIDGTGMCGGCRVLIDGKSEFACVDGPEFDAHRVDFAVLVQRNAMYRDAEKRAMDEYLQEVATQKPEAKQAQEFTEVNLGYSEELARQEAIRCLECAKPTCVSDCPVGVKVKDFVQLIVEGKYMEAAAKIREDNVLPAITGRVCPQEDHCEGACLLKKKGESLGIGYLERFVADYEQRHFVLITIIRPPPRGKKVAIVGSGPSGLTAAGDLVQKG